MGSQKAILISSILNSANQAENLKDFYGRSLALILEEFNFRAGALISAEDDLFVLEVARGASPGIWRMPPLDVRKTNLGRLSKQGSRLIDNPSSLEISDYFKGFKSAALIPIMARGYLLGIIVLFGKNKEAFVKVDLSDLEKIGETIGIVSLFFKDIDLQTENQKQREEISALGGMLKNLSHSLDYQEMLASLLAAAAKITKADMVALATYNKGENALIVHPTTHNIDKIKSTALKFGHDEKIGGATFCKGKIHVLNSLDEEHRNHFEKTELKNIRSLMAIPLKTRSQSVGVMYLLSERENNFQNIDLSILEKIASLISAALSHSEVTQVLAEERQKSTQIDKSLAKEKDRGSLLARLELGFSSLYGEQLKTPILGIKELLEMILAGEAGEIEKSSRRVIQEAKLATLRLHNLVENIIYAQKLEKGNIALKPKKIDLHSLIKEVGEVYQKKIEEKGLIFTNNIKNSLWVKCDPEKTRQIISNLFDNSIKFTRKGKINISARGTDQFTEVKFDDTGVGIPTEHLKNLFSKFFRSQTPETQQIPGTGLGLWVTKGLVEAQGGKISASSVRNQGSAFSFSLPKLM